MPVITDPNEPYFKDGIWGWDAVGGLWLPLAVDPTTNYLIVNARGDIEVHQHTPADMLVGTHGWDGTDWHNLPMVWGYSDTYTETNTADAVPAGNRVLTFANVPAGEVWVVTSFVAYCTTANPTYIQLRAYQNGVYQVVAMTANVLALEGLSMQGSVALKQGQNLEAFFSGCFAGDNIRSYARGYKMLIAE